MEKGLSIRFGPVAAGSESLGKEGVGLSSSHSGVMLRMGALGMEDA